MWVCQVYNNALISCQSWHLGWKYLLIQSLTSFLIFNWCHSFHIEIIDSTTIRSSINNLIYHMSGSQMARKYEGFGRVVVRLHFTNQFLIQSFWRKKNTPTILKFLVVVVVFADFLQNDILKDAFWGVYHFQVGLKRGVFL